MLEPAPQLAPPNTGLRPCPHILCRTRFSCCLRGEWAVGVCPRGSSLWRMPSRGGRPSRTPSRLSCNTVSGAWSTVDAAQHGHEPAGRRVASPSGCGQHWDHRGRSPGRSDLIGMHDEAALVAKLHKIEALFARPGTDGERVAAGIARDRIRERLRQLEVTSPMWRSAP